MSVMVTSKGFEGDAVAVTKESSRDDRGDVDGIGSKGGGIVNSVGDSILALVLYWYWTTPHYTALHCTVLDCSAALIAGN